jgi:hypothetical protein
VLLRVEGGGEEVNKKDGRWCGLDCLLSFPIKTKIWNKMGE